MHLSNVLPMRALYLLLTSFIINSVSANIAPLKVEPYGTVIYQRINGTNGRLSFSFKLTNELTCALGLVKQDATMGSLKGVTLHSTTCPFGSKTKFLAPKGNCLLTYQAPIPSAAALTAPINFFNKLQIAYSGNIVDYPPFGITLYPKTYRGHFTFRQGSQDIAALTVTPDSSGKVHLYNTGKQILGGVHIVVPALLQRYFSGDCLTTTTIAPGSACTLNYQVAADASSGAYSLSATSIDANNNATLLTFTINGERALLTFNKQAIALGIADGQQWTRFAAATLKLGMDDTLTHLITQGSTIIAGSQNGYVTSDDEGKMWAYHTGMAGYSAYPEATQIAALQTILAIGTRGGVSVSLDKGVTWHTYSNITPGFSASAVVTALAVGTNAIVVGTHLGVSVSQDKGITWLTANSQTPGFSASNQINTVVTLGGTIWAGTDNGLSWTIDGKTWRTINGDTPGFSHYPDIVKLATDGHRLCALTLWALSISDDAGKTWQTKTLVDMGLSSDANLKAVSCRKEMLAVGTRNDSIAVSIDAGAHWQVSIPGETKGFSPSLVLNQLAINGLPSTVAVATTDGVSVSIDGGHSWQTFTHTTNGFLTSDNSVGVAFVVASEAKR